MTLTLRTFAMPIAALAATLALASCGSGSDQDANGMGGTSSSAPAGKGIPAVGDKNKADVAFAKDMIPHHAQAVEMASMAASQAADPKVKALAEKIKGAQGPEITQMSGWLSGWGEPVPSTGDGHAMSGMSGQTDGMMSADEMTDLGKATGSGFDRMWLKAMVRHHEGAVQMAKTELAEGTNPDAKKLAQAVIDSQSAEITEMGTILAAIPG